MQKMKQSVSLKTNIVKQLADGSEIIVELGPE